MSARILQFIGWPVLVGIAIAALILLLNHLDKWPATNGDDSWQGPVSYADAVRRAAPSVVNIYSRRQVIQRSRHPILDDPILGRLINSRTPRTREAIGLGSGVILSKDGHILTNLHVVARASEISVQLQDGRTAIAEVVGSDDITDLAVLKVGLDNLTPIKTADSMKAEVGQVVLAIGNPQGVGQTVTQGIISAIGQKEFSDSQNRIYQESIQTDAAIHPGNSGGALVDAHGRLLGINNAILSRAALDTTGQQISRTRQSHYSPYGISFAIPTNTALKVLTDIRLHGQVRRGYVGNFSLTELNTQQMQQLGFEYKSGLMVTDAGNESPATSAGLLAGDIIIGINKQRRTDWAYIDQILLKLAPEDRMQLEIVRGGQELVLDIVASVQPSSPRQQ